MSDTCVGLSKRYQLCNDLACPAESMDIRAYQCAAYNKVDFQGRQYNWEPYIKGREYTLSYNICIHVGNRFVIEFRFLHQTMPSASWTASHWVWNTSRHSMIRLLMAPPARGPLNIIAPIGPLHWVGQYVSTAFARWMLIPLARLIKLIKLTITIITDCR